MLVGVIIAAQLVWPELNFGPYLHFGRLRPLHTNAVIFAFGGSALFAASYHVVQRTCQARLISDKLAAFTFWGWQVVIVEAAITLPIGLTTTKEYSELEWPIDILIAVVWVVYAIVFFGTIMKRRARHIYVANWFFGAFILAVAMLHIVNSLAVPVYLAGAAAVYPIWELDIVLATLACCYTIRLLYLGVPPMMNVPEDQGMLYASALFLVFLVYAVVILTATVILWEYVAAPVFINV